MASSDSLQRVIESRTEQIIEHWQRALLAAGGSHTRGLVPQTELNAEMRELLRALVGALGAQAGDFQADPSHPLAASLRNASQLRAMRGYTPEESLHYLQACNEALLGAVSGSAGTSVDADSAASRILRLMDRCIQVLVASFIEVREAVMLRQTESLQEVSTPVITLWDSILLLPLVGIVDSVRAQHISTRLLEAISESEAEVTLIDVTGVPVMDTSVARHILKTVAAAEMLGTRVVITGISPSTAQTVVKLGIDMSGVPTRASLKSGVALAMAMTRRRVVDLPDSKTAPV